MFRCPISVAISATALLGLLACGNAHAQFDQTRSVGATNDCDYATLQAAVNAAASGDSITLQGGQTYAEHITIANKSLTISTALCTPIIGGMEGAAANDSPDTPSAEPRVTISGAGGPNTAVFTITGNSDITLRNLTIRDGHSSGNGGGIYYNATGNLTLINVAVSFNTAMAGAGIEVLATGGPANLTIGADTLISSNTAAGAGGGIRIRGDTHMLMDAPSCLLLNKVLGTTGSGDGGGLQVISPAGADIGSPGLQGFGAITLNEAVNGGGIATHFNGGTIPPRVNLYTTDPLNPVRLQGNRARNVGGAIYLRSETDNLRYQALALLDANLVDNSARNGAAIYSDDYDYVGPGVFATAMVEFSSPYYMALPAQSVRCAAGVRCNEIVDNATTDDDGNPVPGAIVYISAGGWFFGSRLHIQRNQAAQAFFLDDDEDVTELRLFGSLLADNLLSDALIHKNSTTAVSLRQCTVAGNQLGGGSLVVGDVGYFGLTDSILDQPGLTVYTGGGTREADHVLTQDPSMTSYGTNLIFASPVFFSSANSDYRQTVYRLGNTLIASPGIDVLAPVSGDDRDVDNRPFDQDVSFVVDGEGVRDLGAYEAQPINSRIFADGFGDPLILVY